MMSETMMNDLGDEDFQNIEVEKEEKAIPETLSQPQIEITATTELPLEKKNQIEETLTNDAFQPLLQECSGLLTRAMHEITKWSEEIKQGTETFKHLQIAPYLQADALNQVELRKEEWETHVQEMVSFLEKMLARPKRGIRANLQKLFSPGDRVSVGWNSRFYQGFIGSSKIINDKRIYCVHYDDTDLRMHTEEELITKKTKKIGVVSTNFTSCNCK
jgi:hypothetical protein